MPKHFKTQEEKWEFFLNAILKKGNVKVTSLKNKNLVIKLDLDGFNELKAVLLLPDLLKSKVPHLGREVKKSAVVKSYLDERVEELTQLNGQNIIERLFNGEATSIFNGLFTEQLDNDSIKHLISTSKCSKTSFGLKEAQLQFLIATTNQYTDLQIARTMLALEDQIDDDQDFKANAIDISEVFSIKKVSDKAVVQFNYGLFVKKIYELSINTDDLLQYLYSSFNSGVIFKEEGLDKLIPMLFEPAQKNTGSDTFNGHINLILDISGSMGNVSEEYIKKIKELVQTIKESVHSQTLTTFNHKITSYTFNLDDMLDRVRLNLLIDGLEMGGGTDLYGALNDALAAQEKTRSSLTLFITDGYHTEGGTSLDQLNPLNPQATPQAELVLLGFGNYDKVLFQDIARKTGLIHHYLDSLSELPEMEQYISQLGYKKIAYEFLKESERAFIERVPEGSVSISDNEVDRSYLARVIGDCAESYSIIASNLE